MIQEKALRMALEALRKARRKVLTTEECHAVIMSIKDALAQPEPVMHTLNCVCGAVWDVKTDGSEEMVHTPYTTPPQRKPLTDEHIGVIAIKSQDGISPHDDTLRFARAIEAAHGIKE